ncbi:MAG TPA: cobalt ECF transporter T component CbiQ [Desulfobacteraceae bacterium]|nr:cobalt ECF transporter T component CbiQ [Desulfobacteraceae bacterium]
METEDFVNGNSFIHQLDPRARVIIAICLSVLISIMNKVYSIIPSFAISIVFLMLARPPFKRLLKRLILANGFIAILWLVLPFSIEGVSILRVGPLNMTAEGVRYTALLTFKSNAILILLITFISTMDVFTLAKAMQGLHFPSKIIQLIIFTYRYLHVLHREYEKMIKTLKVKCFEPKTNLNTYRTFAYMVAMLILKSYDRSIRVENAMRCRGYNGRFYNLTEFSFKREDLKKICIISFLFFFMVILKWKEITY